MYTEDDKRLAMTLYAITGSPFRAGEWWGRIKGVDTYPDIHTIKKWGEAGVLPSEEAVNALKAVYKGRFLDQEIQTFEMAHEAVRDSLDKPTKNLFYLNGVLMTTADRARQVIFPTQREGTNIINMVGPSFAVSSKERADWTVEEVKEADGSGS